MPALVGSPETSTSPSSVTTAQVPSPFRTRFKGHLFEATRAVCRRAGLPASRPEKLSSAEMFCLMVSTRNVTLRPRALNITPGRLACVKAGDAPHHEPPVEVGDHDP